MRIEAFLVTPWTARTKVTRHGVPGLYSVVSVSFDTHLIELDDGDVVNPESIEEVYLHGDAPPPKPTPYS